MLTSTTCIFILAINLFLLKHVKAQLTSPCPHYFTYVPDGSGGIFTLPALKGVNDLKVIIAFLGSYDQNSKTVIDYADGKNEALKSYRNGANVRYKITFPDNLEHVPQIQSFSLNDQEYCNNENAKPQNYLYSLVQVDFKVIAGSNDRPVPPKPIEYSPNPPPRQTPRPTPRPIPTPFPRPIPRPTPSQSQSQSLSLGDNLNLDFSDLPQRINEPPDVSNRDWILDFPFNEKCGIHSVAVHTVINGRDVKPNEFPWLVALFDFKRVYFCGGSLISDKHVITAAHCTIDKNWVYIELGKHTLSNTDEPGIATRISERIINHPQYKKRTGHADISLIIISGKVTFSPKIKPICLWGFQSYDVGKKGTVAGWGNDISGSPTDTPMAAEVSIVSDEECVRSDNVYSTVISNSTFCAGGTDKGPCSGDSGSGFILNDQDRWYLKGVISVAISQNPRAGSCDVSKYAVYCDVGKYLGWLKDFLI